MIVVVGSCLGLRQPYVTVLNESNFLTPSKR